MDILRRQGPAGRMAMVIGVGALLTATAACNDEGSSAKCDDGTCHLVLRGHQSLALDHDHAQVTHVGDDRMTVSWHGLALTVKEGLTVKIGKYTLRLRKVSGGSAHVDLVK